MGSTRWSDDEYERREKLRRKTGKSAFVYSDDTIRNTERSEWKTHPLMDPKGVTRESRDSATHPESLAIDVGFDVTGSMQGTPRVFQKNLKRLMGLLMQKAGVEHPQILTSAVGDAKCDKAPLQIGQYESGIEIDNDLGRLLLEGGGGGNNGESYDLKIYFTARHTSIDCWEKRQKKGYLILGGDEYPFDFVSRREVKEIIGDDISEDISIKTIIAEARKRYHIFMIRPTDTDWGGDKDIHQKWVSLLGKERVLLLEDPEVISEVIALVVGITEGNITKEEGIKAVKKGDEVNLSAKAIQAITNAISVLPDNPSKIAEKKVASVKVETKTEPKKKDGKAGRL